MKILWGNLDFIFVSTHSGQGSMGINTPQGFGWGDEGYCGPTEKDYEGYSYSIPFPGRPLGQVGPFKKVCI